MARFDGIRFNYDAVDSLDLTNKMDQKHVPEGAAGQNGVSLDFPDNYQLGDGFVSKTREGDNIDILARIDLGAAGPGRAKAFVGVRPGGWTSGEGPTFALKGGAGWSYGNNWFRAEAGIFGEVGGQHVLVRNNTPQQNWIVTEVPLEDLEPGLIEDADVDSQETAEDTRDPVAEAAETDDAQEADAAADGDTDNEAPQTRTFTQRNWGNIKPVSRARYTPIGHLTVGAYGEVLVGYAPVFMVGIRGEAAVGLHAGGSDFGGHAAARLQGVLQVYLSDAVETKTLQVTGASISNQTFTQGETSDLTLNYDATNIAGLVKIYVGDYEVGSQNATSSAGNSFTIPKAQLDLYEAGVYGVTITDASGIRLAVVAGQITITAADEEADTEAAPEPEAGADAGELAEPEEALADRDNDGVADKDDLCSETPSDVKADSDGCGPEQMPE